MLVGYAGKEERIRPGVVAANLRGGYPGNLDGELTGIPAPTGLGRKRISECQARTVGGRGAFLHQVAAGTSPIAAYAERIAAFCSSGSGG
jgi:hypothetical protein